MSRARWGILAVALVIIAAGVWWFRGRGGGETTATAARGSIDVTIQTIGTLQATDAAAVQASQAGVVAQLGVAAGDVVRRGDVVALLERAPFERAVEDANRRVTNAEFTLQVAEQRAGAAPDDAQARLDALNAGAAVEAAQRALDDARTALNESAILAPADGTVLELNAQVGGAVGAEQLVARIARPGAFEIVADVDELDLPNVAPGAEARFRLDAFPASELRGVVTSTAAQARQQGGATVFATTIAFNAPSGLDLRPGMNADVTIVTAARDNVLLIPESALKTVGDRSFVTVVQGGIQVEREVTLGYRGNGQVEIVSGLDEGEKVLLP